MAEQDVKRRRVEGEALPSGREAGTGSRLADQSNRVANRDFKSESQGELELSIGNQITVTHDPEEGQQNNIHRWVYGRNEATQQMGWFPLSHTT
mmetsp:Transcript_91050/g.256613  ORF Transcript_91050/g.256613 Transcript_91050/m.256613 type:complete len:94 (+) Transcript_91050:106-387(+)